MTSYLFFFSFFGNSTCYLTHSQFLIPARAILYCTLLLLSVKYLDVGALKYWYKCWIFALVLIKSTNGLWTRVGNHVIWSTCSWHLFSPHSLKMRFRIRWGFFVCLFLFLAMVWVKTLLYSLFLVKNSLSGLLHYMTMALKIWRQRKLIVILRPYNFDVVVFCSLVFSSYSGWKMFTLNHNWREARWFLLFLIGDRERNREVTINEVILCISFLSENKITFNCLKV